MLPAFRHFVVLQANSQRPAITMLGARFDQACKGHMVSLHVLFMIRSIIKNAVFLIQLKDL